MITIPVIAGVGVAVRATVATVVGVLVAVGVTVGVGVLVGVEPPGVQVGVAVGVLVIVGVLVGVLVGVGVGVLVASLVGVVVLVGVLVGVDPGALARSMNSGGLLSTVLSLLTSLYSVLHQPEALGKQYGRNLIFRPLLRLTRSSTTNETYEPMLLVVSGTTVPHSPTSSAP